MSSAEPQGTAAGSLPGRDKAVIGLVVFFTVVALTLELYWLIFNQQMEVRTDLFARIFALYWPADTSYRIPGYSVGKSLALALEGVNTAFTPVLSLVLVWAILKQRAYRYALQLVIASYTFYGTFLYLAVAYISNYANFESRSLGTYLMLHLANLPWLLGYAWIGWDAFRAIVQRAQNT